MSSRIAERVDPWRMADQGREVSGRFEIDGFQRLVPLLASTAGDAVFYLVFERDAQRRAIVRGKVEAALSLTCQRCLEPVTLDVSNDVMLAVVSGVDEAAGLPDVYDALLVEEGLVVVKDMVEEELLLAVPSVPRHEGGCVDLNTDSGDQTSDDETKATSPFDVLAELRDSTRKN